MSIFTVPAAGLQVQHTEPDSKQPSQILRLNIASNDASDLLRFVRGGGSAHLRTGRVSEVKFGTKHVTLHQVQDRFPQEIFRGPLDGSELLYSTGRLNHILEAKHSRAAIAGIDEALDKLQGNLASAREGKSPDPYFISNKLLKSQHISSPLAGSLLGSRPSSPFLSAGISPRVGPTSAPLLSGQSKAEKTKYAAIKIPAIHLLAVQPQRPETLAETLRIKRADLDQVLQKIAQDTNDGGKKKLRDKAYRDLDVWKFPYASQHDRQLAVDHAVSAYDRQRIEKSDNLWQMLLAKEDRGKGINLSKLNFDKPLAVGTMTPKLPERSTDGGSTEGKSMNSTTSENSSRKGKVPVSKVTDSQPKARPTAEKLAKDLKNFGKSSTKNKVPEKAKGHVIKTDMKYKSTAKIENSDEEAGATLDATGPTSRKRDITRPSPPDKTSSATPNLPLHRSHPVGSSTLSSDPERGRLTPNSAMVRTRGGKETVGRGEKNIEATKNLESSRPRNVSRPRNDSSPHKPSPLGSSPPTNSRDVDSTSVSSKSTTLSSAPSSPPVTSNSPQSKTQPSKLTNGVKRKAEDYHDAPPAKKQHLTSDKNDVERFNSLPKSLTDEINNHLPGKRDSPDSEASSGNDKLKTKEQLVEEARNFHKYYARYKDLHETLNKTSTADRNEEDLDLVWKMHRRLEQMKKQIWRDWGRLEKRQ